MLPRRCLAPGVAGKLENGNCCRNDMYQRVETIVTMIVRGRRQGRAELEGGTVTVEGRKVGYNGEI